MCLVLICGGGYAFANDDHAKPFADIQRDQAQKYNGSIFSLFDARERELMEFKRPSDGYGHLVARRNESLRFHNARGSGLVSEPETEAYLNGVLLKLLEANGFGDLEPRVYLHSGSGAEASVTPDGGIFVSIGLVQALLTENEVAFVLAHELAHFLLQHHDTDWYLETQSRVLTGVDTLLTVGAATGLTAGQQGAEILGDLQKIALIGAAIYDISDNFIHAPWQREQEQEADHLGTDLLVGAGYDPYDSEGVMQFMAESEVRNKAKRDAARSAMETRSAEIIGLNDQTGRDNFLVTHLLKGLGTFLNEVGASHYSAEERKDDIFEYNEKHYGDISFIQKISTPWAANQSHPINVIIKNYRGADQALTKMEAGDLGNAEKLARKSVTGITRYHAHPRVIFQRIRRAQGQISKAEQNLDLAKKNAVTPTIIYMEYLNLANKQRNYTAMTEIVSQAQVAAGGELPQLLPYLVYARKAAGDDAEAFQMQKTCEINRPELQKSCSRAFRGEYPGNAGVVERGRGVQPIRALR